MSHQADIARQELLEAARVAERHIREKEMGYAEQISSRNRKAMKDGQFGHDNAQPEDDLTFLDDDSDEAMEFDRTEEEELMLTGAGRVIEPERLWQALCWRSEFRSIRDEVIKGIMATDSYKLGRKERMELDAQQRMEP